VVGQPFSIRTAYYQSIRGLLRLHAITQNGETETPEAEAIRDSLEHPWCDLSEAEKKRITGLSEDLYTISDPPSEPPPMNPQAQRKLLEALQARQSGDWDTALELLRRWGKHLDPGILSFLRGTVWLAAGDSETATAFFQHAAQLDPNDGDFMHMYLCALRKSQPSIALTRAREIVYEAQTRHPVVLAEAANIFVASTLGMPPVDAHPVLQQSIHALESAWNRLETCGTAALSSPESARIGLSMLLGFCHERIGDHQGALRHYNFGLSLDPGNEAMLIARGGLRYGVDPFAADDFEQAIRQGSVRVWPYFFLAHHQLVGNRFDECRRMCERALELPASDEIRANLHEWIAISEAELGFPAELVRSAFEQAIRLAPDVNRIRQNLEEYAQAAVVKRGRGLPWGKPTESTIQAVWRAGYSPIAA
jgi:tetratricopeptide (TPR) repeat protein